MIVGYSFCLTLKHTQIQTHRVSLVHARIALHTRTFKDSLKRIGYSPLIEASCVCVYVCLILCWSSQLWFENNLWLTDPVYLISLTVLITVTLIWKNSVNHHDHLTQSESLRTISIYVYTTLIKHFNKNRGHSHRKWPHAITICEETQNRTATEEALVVIRVLKTICVRTCFYFEHDLRMTALLNMSSGVRLQVLSSRLTALTCWALWKMFVFSPKCKRRWIAVLFWQEAHRT